MTKAIHAYKATFRKDAPRLANGRPDHENAKSFTMVFANENYELARDHALHCAHMQGLAFCAIERLPRAEGQKALDEIGGKFIEGAK